MENNEKEYFERDYAVGKEKSEEAEKFFNRMIEIGAMKAYHDVLIETPKIIIPKDKEAFEYLRERSDSFARAERGKVKAWIDYEKYEAWIYVICPLFRFESPKRREYLKDVAEKATNVTFEIKNDVIEMHIYIPYFDDLADEETHEKAWEALFATFEQEDLERLCENEDDFYEYPDDMD